MPDYTSHRRDLTVARKRFSHESATQIVGKATAHEEHLLCRLYLEVGLRNINFCSKQHLSFRLYSLTIIILFLNDLGCLLALFDFHSYTYYNKEYQNTIADISYRRYCILERLRMEIEYHLVVAPASR